MPASPLDSRPVVRRRPFSGTVGQLLLAATLAGALVAALLLPLVGGVGLVAKGAADSFQDLPAELQVPPLPQASRILAADGSTLATFYDENRVSVPLAKVAPVMRNAIVAIEDSRFYEHHGLDFRGVIRAAVTNSQAGGVQQGGSTLTQQYVKNVLLESATTAAERRAANAPTLTRKLREARYALALEQRWSKDKILESYLNIAYFGSGSYGIAAAARHYFDTSPSKLSLAQAATLAGIVRSPSEYDPIMHPKAAKLRRDTVLQRMAELGKISESAATKAIAARMKLHVTSVRNGCVGTPAAFFCDYVFTQLRNDPALGASEADRVKLLLRGGLTIKTSLDPKTQQAAEKALADKTKVTDQVAAVVDAVEPGTGLIKAMAVNRIYDPHKGPGHTTVNLATGGQAGVQGGSTFKIFTLTAVLQKGLSLDTRLNCPYHYVSSVFTNNGAPYSVYNAENGPVSNNIYTATWDSVNTCFVQLEERIGTAAPVKVAESLGVRNLNGTPLNRGGSFTLGTDSVSPLAMAGVYATYAAHGMYCAPVGILSVTGPTGQSYGVTKPSCSQQVDKGIADTVSSVLEGVIKRGTGVGAAMGRPAAGKTGTAQGYSAAWFDGFTPQLAAAVWMGDPRGGFHHPLKDVRVGGTFYPRVFGGTISAPIWGDFMKQALKGQPVEQLAKADPKISHGKQVNVPDVSGLSYDAARARLKAAGLAGYQAGTVSGGTAGTVAYTSPGSGSTVGTGSAVGIYLSNGQVAAAPSPTPSPTLAPKPSPPSHHPKPRKSFHPPRTRSPGPPHL